MSDSTKGDASGLSYDMKSVSCGLSPDIADWSSRTGEGEEYRPDGCKAVLLLPIGLTVSGKTLQKGCALTAPG